MPEFGADRLWAYLVVALVLFGCGVLAVSTRRNAIGVLIGVELMLNSAALQFAAYGRFRQAADHVGAASAVFVVVVAAAEAAVALALLFAVYRTSKDIDLEQARELGS